MLSIYSPLRSLFLLFNTITLCWQEASPGSTTWALLWQLLHKQLFMDPTAGFAGRQKLVTCGICAPWDIDEASGLWHGLMPCHPQPPLTCVVIWMVWKCLLQLKQYFFTWNKYRASFRHFFWHILPSEFQLLTGITGSTDFALYSSHSATGALALPENPARMWPGKSWLMWAGELFTC